MVSMSNRTNVESKLILALDDRFIKEQVSMSNRTNVESKQG